MIRLRSQGAPILPSVVLPFAVALALNAAGTPAQQIAEGIGHQLTPLPVQSSNVLTLSGDQRIYFDGNDLVLLPPGQPPKTILHLPYPVFGSFALAVTPGHVLFGEATTGALWLVPLAGPAPSQRLTTLPFNYDAVALGPGRVLVSAKTAGWASPSNELVVVDLATGSWRPIAWLPGASGPVAIAPNGDVYYATASPSYPTPPGLTSVLRFRRSDLDLAILDGLRLTASDAQIIYVGLDSASDMCFDDDGDLLFVDWMNNQVGELNDATGPNPWPATPLIDFGGMPGAASLQFLPGSGTGSFEPFQPDGGQLIVHETDFWSTSMVRTMRVSPPQLQAPGPGPAPSGNLTIQVTNGPANAPGVVALATNAAPGILTLAVPGFEQSLHLGAALTGNSMLWPVTFDPQGATSLVVWNPGVFPVATVTVQAVMVSVSGVLAATAPAQMQLGP